MTNRTRALLGQVAAHRALGVGALSVLSPFVLMLRAAFTPEDRIFSGAGLGDLTLENFRIAWESAPWLHYYANSVLSCAAIFAGQVAVCLPAAYALARLDLPGGRGVFWLVIACLAIPAQVVAVPLYVAFSGTGLTDSLTSLVLPFLGSAFAIFLFRQFILTIPQSIFDAARMDGVGPLGMVWRIVLPNIRPALVAFGVFSVVGHWNDLFWPTVMLRSERAATIPYALLGFVEEETGARYGAQMAAAVLALIPLFVVFVLVQRRLVEGVSLSGSQE
jgi:multiple sugar transport system permease protein